MEASPPSLSDETAFLSDDVEEIAGYRKLSALAVVSLGLGLASPLSFAAPLLLTIPIVGTALSIVALRRIAASEGALGGQWAAAAGLALSVALGLAAVSRQQTTRLLRVRQAESFAHETLALLTAGDVESAFRRTVDGARPTPPPPEPGLPKPDKTPYEKFTEQPLIQTLMAAGADAQIQLVETEEYFTQPGKQYYVRQRFRVTPPAANQQFSRPLEVIVRLHRSRFDRNSPLRWLIAGIDEPIATTGGTIAAEKAQQQANKP